jgi:hypothetical protein
MPHVSQATRTPRGVASVECSNTSVLVRGRFDPATICDDRCLGMHMAIRSGRFAAFRDIDFGGSFVHSPVYVCIPKSPSFPRIGKVATLNPVNGLISPLDFLIRVNLRGLSCPIHQRPLCRLFPHCRVYLWKAKNDGPKSRTLSRFASIGFGYVSGHASTKGNTRVRHHKEQQRTFVLL